MTEAIAARADDRTVSSIDLNTAVLYPAESLRGPNPSYRSSTTGAIKSASEMKEIILSPFKASRLRKGNPEISAAGLASAPRCHCKGWQALSPEARTG